MSDETRPTRGLDRATATADPDGNAAVKPTIERVSRAQPIVTTPPAPAPNSRPLIGTCTYPSCKRTIREGDNYQAIRGQGYRCHQHEVAL